ncbi:nucleotidyltransferase family protein [Sphingobacterium thalpophilum]|uniref:nucleotidyltransferase family protein n=1 Tax=Sphingobacterium thalpophilum TaxID=259 RepID=UPI0031D3CAC9
MEERIQTIFLKLLRSGLWGRCELPIETKLEEQDWELIYKYAISHTVEGIIYDSLNFLKSYQLPPSRLLLKWSVRIDQIERHNSKMNEVISTQYKTFTEFGLRPVLQKGQGVAYFYNNPSHRSCGDIDWYFEKNDYLKARAMIKAKNVSIRDTAGFSLSYEWDRIHIEHHKKLFDIQSPFKIKFLKNLELAYRNKHQQLLINNVKVPILSSELQIFQINCHILKHLLAFGIGLRQICDSARIYYSTISQINKKDLKRLYKKAGILNWIHLLHDILVRYLGLPETSLPFSIPKNVNAEWMFDEIWNSGNFGFHDIRFKQGKISKVSRQPDGVNRLWRNFKRYVKYVPQEAFFFPLIQSYSRFLGKDKD